MVFLCWTSCDGVCIIKCYLQNKIYLRVDLYFLITVRWFYYSPTLVRKVIGSMLESDIYRCVFKTMGITFRWTCSLSALYQLSMSDLLVLFCYYGNHKSLLHKRGNNLHGVGTKFLLAVFDFIIFEAESQRRKKVRNCTLGSRRSCNKGNLL